VVKGADNQYIKFVIFRGASQGVKLWKIGMVVLSLSPYDLRVDVLIVQRVTMFGAMLAAFCYLLVNGFSVWSCAPCIDRGAFRLAFRLLWRRNAAIDRYFTRWFVIRSHVVSSFRQYYI
jgi:ABC-type Co2+ transport system permease subunit